MGQNSIEYFLKSLPQVTFKETFKNYKFESQHCTIDHESVFKMFESSDLLLKSVLWILLIFMALLGQSKGDKTFLSQSFYSFFSFFSWTFRQFCSL